MASNFSSLRSSRKDLINKLSNQIKNESQKQGADERFWKLTVDPKTKIGYATLRFLPAPKNEDVPWVRLWSHGFSEAGSWYIENCPTTLGRDCPVCKENNKLWNADKDSDSPLKKIARDRKRKLSFISNVLVINDTSHPENNGKVFLFRYGSKIHDKIKELIEPQFPDQEPTDPFDMWTGADFKLKSSLVKSYQNYDKSEFMTPSELFGGDDAKMEALWEIEFPLQPFIAEDQFKTFDDLEKRLSKVLTGTSDKPLTAAEAVARETALPTDKDVEEAVEVAKEIEKVEAKKTARKTSTKPTPTPAAPVVVEDVPENEDDLKDFFSKVLD